MTYLSPNWNASSEWIHRPHQIIPMDEEAYGPQTESKNIS